MVTVIDRRTAEKIKKSLNGNGGARQTVVSTGIYVPEQEMRLKDEAAARAAQAKENGRLIAGSRRGLRQLLDIQSAGILTVEQEKGLKMLRIVEKVVLQGCDEVLQRYSLISAFTEEVKAVKRDRGALAGFFDQAVRNGWYRLAMDDEKSDMQGKGSWPEGTVKAFNGDVFLLNPVMTKEFSLEMEEALKVAVLETRTAEKEAEEKAMKRFLAEGNHDLSKLDGGAPGVYVLRFYPDGKKHKEGVGVVSVEEQKFDNGLFWVIRAVNGAGSLAWLCDHKDEWIPFKWFKCGLPKNAKSDVAEFSDRFCRTLFAAVRIYKTRSRKEAETADPDDEK